MAPRVSILWISSYTIQNLGFPVVSAFPSTSGRSGHAKALLSGDGSAIGRREEDMWRRILGLEAWASGRLRLSMILEGGKRRVGDGFRISERFSVVDTVSISASIEKPGCSVFYCSDDSIHSSLPGIGENVGALGGS